MTAERLSDWLSAIGGNAVLLNGGSQTLPIWERTSLLIRLFVQEELKMKETLLFLLWGTLSL